MDGSKAIRGGIPVVFPNFGPWKCGPQHGFARISHWAVEQSGDDFVILSLSNTKKTENMWNYKFRLQYTIRILNNNIYTILTVENSGEEEFDFTALLHTYLSVDVPSLEVHGFTGVKCTNSLTGNEFEEVKNCVTIDQNVDQIYENVEKHQTVKSATGIIEVRRDGLPGLEL